MRIRAMNEALDFESLRRILARLGCFPRFNRGSDVINRLHANGRVKSHPHPRRCSTAALATGSRVHASHTDLPPRIAPQRPASFLETATPRHRPAGPGLHQESVHPAHTLPIPASNALSEIHPGVPDN